MSTSTSSNIETNQSTDIIQTSDEVKFSKQKISFPKKEEGEEKLFIET